MLARSFTQVSLQQQSGREDGVRDFTANHSCGQVDENLQTRSVKMLTMFTKEALKCDFPHTH